MTIKAIKGMRGEELALCSCRACCAEETVRAAHDHNNGFRKGGRANLTLANLKQPHEKLQSMGWGIVGNKIYCPSCEAKRKAEASAQKEAIMAEQKTNVAPIRQPTPEQEVDIIVTLSSAYDRKARRYHGKETDKTVAETVGGGVMPGWVAAIREAKFGPAGNEEIGLIREEMARLKADHDVMIDGLRRDMEKNLAALTKRLDACVASHDRRVG